MGATRKLALVVVVGLIAISTAITVYTANEPNRRGDETSEQQGVSIERASSLYITYCLSCHGPAGLGVAEVIPDVDYRRTGGILNQSIYSQEQLDSVAVVFQSDDPVQQGIAEDWVRFRIMYGIPAEGQVKQDTAATVTMPSFRHDLNVEEINSLVWLVMHGDWNYVYNQAVHQTGLGVCEATPEADRSGMCEGDMHDAVAYPTAPPPAATDGEEDADSGATPEADNGGSGEATGGDHQVIATDSAFDIDSITVKPGDTITLTNNGFLEHDIAVQELGLESELIGNGESITITIPEDAAPGDYEFICTVPGHKEAGMVGTLTVEAP